MKKTVIYIFLLIMALGVSLFLLQPLVMPKYVTSIVEGGLLQEYYQETTGHDVIFLGDCEVYGNISPVYLWEHFGITSFVRGTPEQLMWHSYYMLEDTLRYEKPRVVVLSVLSLNHPKLGREEYNRLSLDGMKWSVSKVMAIRDSMNPDEKWLDYLFPFLRYHSRWSELNQEDFHYWFREKKTSHNGYYMRVDVRPARSVPVGKKLPDYRFKERPLYFLDRIEKLCRKEGITLVLFKAPSLYPYWYEQWDRQVRDYAQKKGLLYLNTLAQKDSIGLDYEKDTYDMGLHLNLSGTEKLTRYLGEQLKKHVKLPDRRQDQALTAVWKKKVNFYNQMEKDQYKELEKYGYLKSFGARAPEGQ